MKQEELQENNLEEEYEEEEEENRKYIWLFFIIALLLMLFIVIGFTYSLYSGTISGDVQPIGPDGSNIVFNYSDTSGSHNGISITNAEEMTDIVGKKQIGEGNVFNFSISGDTKNNNIKYYVVLKADQASTISDKDVKVYLTSKKGNGEVEINSLVPTYDELKDITIDGETYKVLYEKKVTPNSKFTDEYSLRMWIREGATDYYGKSYSLKVNVLAEGVGE